MTIRTCTRLVAILAICGCWQLSIRAAEPTLQEILAKPILAADTVDREVQVFCDARVQRMPEAKSIAEWEKVAAQMRAQTLEKVVFRGEAARWRDTPGKVEWLETIEGGPGYTIKKLRYEAVPGLWIPALLYQPEKLSGKHPVFLNVNGHDPNGKAADYKQTRCINQAKRGIIALNIEWLGMGQLRSDGFGHSKLNQIDLCGTSGLATFYLSMSRGIDILLAHAHADNSRVGVAGLSGGGWQTIIISSLDTRVTLTNPVAGYSSFRTRITNHSDLGDSEQTPVDLATTADYAQLTAMLAPRVALLTFNQKDNCCFAAPHALPPLLEAARPIYKLYDKEANLHDHTNHDPGTHNFLRDNREALYKVIGQHWYADDASFSLVEIECEKEIKTAEQLRVELPADNLDLHELALRLASGLPKTPAPPTSAAEIARWQPEARVVLAKILHTRDWKVEAEKSGEEKIGELSVTRWKLTIGNSFTVPAVELSRGEPMKMAMVLADEGRATFHATIEKLLGEGYRVLAVDPFYFGESKVKQRDYLFALLASAVGERPLGIQTTQVAAIARWLKNDRNLTAAHLDASGERTSLIALCAAATEPDAISSLRMEGSLASLKDVITQNHVVEKTPEQFTFGLLESFDIPHLRAIVAPREILP